MIGESDQIVVIIKELGILSEGDLSFLTSSCVSDYIREIESQFFHQ